MLEKVSISDVLFLDIETVSGKIEFSALSERMQKLWEKKCRVVLRRPAKEDISQEEVAETYAQRAGIFAEFGKIVCISVGYWNNRTKEFRTKSFYGDDERVLLEEFSNLLDRHFNDPQEHFICGHNIKEFDIPFTCRRMIINGLSLPAMLKIEGKKPWELAHFLDTMTVWKFGDFKNYTSLDLLAAVLDIETPKDDIDGSMVGMVYYQEEDLDRIARYCEKDVVTSARVLQRMKGVSILRDDQIANSYL